MLTAMMQVPADFTAFTHDGTQAGIDAFSVLLAQDGGGCLVQYVNGTTYSFKNPMFDNVFYPRDISEITIVQKFPNNGATFVTILTAIPQLSGMGFYWASA